MSSLYISDQDALVSLCQTLEEAHVLSVDTEFVRTRTLYPKLGLIQVYDGHQLALIDPLSVDDLQPFWDILANQDICKVLHACSEDLEVFLHTGNCRPKNLIDSQIMMAFLGHGISVGYAAMVKHFLAIELDKSESRTDWLKRPLSDKQLAYAAADVSCLYQIYPKLVAELADKGWLNAAKQESERLIERKFWPVDESHLYRQVKLSWKLRAEQLNRLQYLALWRYKEAQRRDLPLGFVAKDHTLLGIAQFNPKSVGAMNSIEGIDILDVRHKGKRMLGVIKQANDADVVEYPEEIIRLDQYPNYKQVYKRLKTFLVKRCQEVDLAFENFASKKQINQYLSWYFKINQTDSAPEKVDLLQGWRHEVLSDRLVTFSDNNFFE